ncbi:protein-disulfide isomerase [Okibacterium sp. HSC-33S16]|uniref:DsbA family protein n=1 Tax=Okibacterium sp. HSC-33S16 TaxID=2910965 RepID=UPI00209FD3D5|nr:thioredoxin domain-containing protein [Okibacterium sp. HSC-33S16]MCP2030167.1 protein-disulfide isomerase [Okibacterium sp. HSC-33S16]
MTNGGPESSPTKNQRREAAREKAKELRNAQRRRDIRNRIFLQGGLVLAIVAVVAGIAFVISSAIRPPTAGPSNMASDGIVIGEQLKAAQTSAIPAGSEPVPTEIDANVPNIRIYVDYLCPICGEFEKANAEQLATWAENGVATVEYHPIAILTGRSAGTQYSLRAANAAACVANYSPDSFFVFSTMLFDDQPEEGTEGHSDEELSAIAKTALNAGDEAGSKAALTSISNCIDDGTYKSWVEEATDRATTEAVPNSKLEKVKGTPTVLVNDKQYTGSITDPKEFQAFVLSVASETYAQSSATPTPTPTEVPAG